ncbi:hypothetical protein LEP1GSC150_0970 [Leptospira interrogans serovar Copenhageni str. LT2050]|uniref:Uncharacterized protein n=1 Tax=Leptospira interrogans serovar Copenhageni str. LT2050 TaxID=1001598 RepID=M3IU77_LEPIT|nr:hypothetical protein LEP1GSC150_0970 [Leptospira interrogans serovar Copenhageni str. LT2050]
MNSYYQYFGPNESASSFTLLFLTYLDLGFRRLLFLPGFFKIHKLERLLETKINSF